MRTKMPASELGFRRCRGDQAGRAPPPRSWGALGLGLVAAACAAACEQRPAVCSLDSDCPGEERCIEKVCDGQFTRALTLVGKQNPVAAEWLNSGKATFTLYCRPCHGGKGVGDGPAASSLRPPPRDLTIATFKFAGVVDGLPHDDDLERILRGGLTGTAMLPWDLPKENMYAVIQYLKTFPAAGQAWTDRDAELGKRVTPPPDEWTDKKAALERGKVLYHAVATCQSCHPAYATRNEIYEMSLAVKAAGKREDAITAFRANMFQPEPKESPSFRDGKVNMLILPPDFLHNPVRSLSPARPEHYAADLFRIIGSGIPGTAMPAWTGALPDRDLWALAHYVYSLVSIRDTPAGVTQQATLAADTGEWKPPEGSGMPSPVQ